MSKRILADEYDPETVNVVLSALSNEYNREVVNYFRQSTETVASVDELVQYIENKQGTGVSHPEQLTRRVHHSDLPKLAETGLIDYDPRSKTVQCWDHPVFELDGVGSLFEVA